MSALAMIAGPDGAMWFTDANGPAIGRISMDGTITRYPISAAHPTYMTLGPDGNFWFAISQPAIGRITPSGFVSIIPLSIPKNGAHGIVTGPLQGTVRNLWFTIGQDKICELSTGGRILAKFRIPTRGFPSALTAGPDGNLWFLETSLQGINSIVRMTPSGVFTYFPLPTSLSFLNERYLAVGRDGNLYTAELQTRGNGILVQVTPAGVVSTINMGDQYPGVIATGPDGNPWFFGTSFGLGYFDIKYRKIIHLGFPPNALGGSPSIGAGPDGNVWMPITNADFSEHVDVFVRRIITVSPNSVSLAVGQSQTVTVSETKYAGLWTAASSNQQIATVAKGKSKGEFVITAMGTGGCTVTIADLTQNTTPVSVTVH